jgi:hypothetical protein
MANSVGRGAIPRHGDETDSPKVLQIVDARHRALPRRISPVKHLVRFPHNEEKAYGTAAA